MATHVDRFAAAAEGYCAWSESPPGDTTAECRAAIRHLSSLYHLGLKLHSQDNADLDLDAGTVERDAWQLVYSRHRALPFAYYWEVFDPHSESPEEAVAGDLADDLADIYGDLLSGLFLFRTGHVAEAEEFWHDHFQFHWGVHAASALRVLHLWFQQDRKRWTA